MSRRWIAMLPLAACAAALVGAPSALAAPSGDLCKLDAALTFGPGKWGAGAAQFKLSGTMASCQSNPSGGPTDAVVEIGQIYTDAATGKQYREPLGSGTGGCLGNDVSPLQGTAIVRWKDGGVTLIPVSITSAGPGFAYVVGSPPLATLQLDPVDPVHDYPIVLKTTAYAGYSSYGALQLGFSPTDCAGGGVGSATLTGVFGPVAFS